MIVERDVQLADGVVADFYAPGNDTAVVIAAGYPGNFKAMASNQSWAERIADAGMTAIAYSDRDPVRDFLTVLGGIEARRIAVWSCSGNVPVALQALTRRSPVRIACAAFLYPYTIDVAEAAAQFRFADPAVTSDEIDASIPLFIARAGRDEMPGLNDRLDAFVQQALARNTPLTLVNYADAPHAFDVSGGRSETAEVIDAVLRFLSR